MARLFLLDGTALAFRSHYAMGTNFTGPDGRPTGATYGFTTTLRSLLAKEKPDLIAVAFDASGPTFRHERFDQYKATRQRAPEEMLAQLAGIREMVEAHGIPVYEIEGYEADDVIATLAREGAEAGHEVYIVTGDKDFMQIVGERVKLYNVFKRGVELVIEDEAAVRDKFGTTPDHVVDVLAIMGDSSDNVPGVKGIGEKGAIKLIEQFGSVDGLLAHLDEVPAKTREKIEACRDILLLSRELVTIDDHVPLEHGLEAVHPPQPNDKRLFELFERYDFRSLMDRLEPGGDDELERNYCLVRDEEQLRAMLKELREAGSFAFDTETTSLFPLEADLVGVSLSARDGCAHYVPFNLDPPVLPGGSKALLEALEPLLTDPSLERIGQNCKYDWLVMAKHGLRMPPPDFDTMVASFCVAGAGRRHNLDGLALHYFGLRKIPTTELIGTGQKQISMADVPVEKVAEYACEDADVTWRLRRVLGEELEEKGATSLFHDLEMPLVPVLAAMEERGVRVDTGLLDQLAGELDAEMQQAVHDIQGLAGENFNVNSTKALGEILFEKLRIQDEAGVKRPKRTKTGWSTDAPTLTERYADVPIVKRLLEYRELAKLKSTYVDSLPRYVNSRTGRIHCSFSQVSAATGRLASSDPNLQNIPIRTERGRTLRKAFVPREPDELGEWVLLSADYSQIELRVMAHFSGDERLIEAFAEGRDIHASTASVIFAVAPDAVTREMRSQAKVINFGLLYGMGPQRVARETGRPMLEARAFIDRYFNSFPKVRVWIDTLLESARQLGYVETLLGRRRMIPDITSENQRTRSLAENAAVNTPIQGSAADIIKRAMIDLERELTSSHLHAGMLLQVHDELLLEVPATEIAPTRDLVKQVMESAVTIAVPLVVECGHGANWLEAH